MKRRTGTILAAVASLLCLAGAAEVSTNGLVHVEKLGHCGFNGAPGVRVRPIGGKRGTYRLDLAFVPKARQKYVFTIYRRIHGNVRPHHYWQCWGRDGWCRGQNWNAKVTPLDGGWEKSEVAIYFEDPEWENGDFRYYVEAAPLSGKTATADDWMDVDCADIREDDPEWHVHNVWPTHNWLFSETGRLRVSSTFVGYFIPKGGESAYRFVLRKPDGKVLAERKMKSSDPAFTVVFGPLSYKGPATVEVTVADTVSRKVCGKRSLPVTVRPTYRPKRDEVFIGEDGRAMLDGKPYMPLGFFTSLVRDRDLDKTAAAFAKMREAGFNCVMEYWMTSLRDDLTAPYYRLCRKNGMRVLYNFSGAYKNTNVVVHVVKAKAQIDAGIPLLGWYTLDEATLTLVDPITKLRHALNELTPGYPTWQVNIREIPPYLGCADVLGGDHYLIGRRQGVLKAMNAYMGIAASCKPAAMWYCPQCFNWANYNRDAANDREKYLSTEDEPTVNEMLAIAFLHASHGVRGFIFYMYDDIFRGPVPEKFEKRWEDVRTVGRTMKSLEPFVMSADPIVEIPVNDVRGKTRAVAMSDGNGGRRVLVIGLDYENEATFTLPEDCRGLKPQFGNATLGEGGTVMYKTGRRSCELFK